MKKLLSFVSFAFVLVFLTSWSSTEPATIAKGNQPQVNIDTKGVVRIVFGDAGSIWCATSVNKGVSFSNPVLVAQVTDMHLGMSRGPQLASSAHYSVITAMDKSGNIHWFRLGHSSQKWTDMGMVNDLKGSAPEGLMGLAADDKDNFYAVWQDIRTGGSNQIYFSSLSSKSNKWSANRLIYRSPDQHVCECCKPNVVVRGNEVAVMFRNWLNGSRDLYVLQSKNGGKTFGEPQKMGMDTWKLNGCPMDGGGITIDATNTVNTVWQRKGDIYYAKPGQPEVYIGKGRTCSMTLNNNKPIIAYQTSDTLKVITAGSKQATTIGNGGFLKTVALGDKSLVCVWEQDNKIKYRKL